LSTKFNKLGKNDFEDPWIKKTSNEIQQTVTSQKGGSKIKYTKDVYKKKYLDYKLKYLYLKNLKVE